MDHTTRTWHLMARTLNGEATQQELDEFHQFLQQNSSLQQQYELLSRIWKEKPRNQVDSNATAAVQRIFDKASEWDITLSEPTPDTSASELILDTSASEPKHIDTKRPGLWYIAAAAVLVFIIGSALLFLQDHKKIAVPSTPEPIIAKNGSRSRSILADGTTVWLNAGSKLIYQNDFKGKTREVKLEGEAFFDVVTIPARPFIVHTSGIDIRVLGTAFNVKSYPEDRNVETTLYRGLVNVYRTNDNRKTVALKPNEKLVLAKEAATSGKELSEVNTSEKSTIAPFVITMIDSTKKENERYETAWLYSRLEFRGDSFEELAQKMERWYNVDIIFSDDKVKQLQLNGSFENETVEQAFEALKTAFPITYKINNNEISVSSSK